MKNMRIAMSVLVLGALVPAAQCLGDGAVNLAPKHKEGDVHRTKVEITANVMGNDVQIVQTTKATVKEIKKNGDVVVISQNEGGKMTLAGQDMDIPPSPPVTETRDKFGKLVEFKLDEAAQNVMSPEIQKVFAMITYPLFPEKSVMSGGTWESVFDNPAVKGKKITVKSTYVGTEKVDGADLWKVKQTSEAETGDNGKLVYEITAWLDPSNGRSVKAESVAKDVPTQYGPMTITMKITAIKDLEKKASN